MKTKDLIAVWLLVFFILVPVGKTFFAFEDALRLPRPLSTILGYLGLTIVVAVSGFFLIGRFVHLTNDLNYYEAEERRREKERQRKSSD